MIYYSLSKNILSIAYRLSAPQTPRPDLPHNPPHNPLCRGSERLIRGQVCPRCAALGRVNTAGFGFRQTLRNLLVDSRLDLLEDRIHRSKILVQWIAPAPGKPLNALAQIGD